MRIKEEIEINAGIINEAKSKNIGLENYGPPTKQKKCEYCGSTKNVSYDINPYDDDINGDDTKHWICDDCFKDMADDI